MSDKLFIRTKDGRIYDLKSKEVSSWEYINKELANKVYKEKEAFYCIYYYDEDKAPYLEIDGKGGHSMDSIGESEILKQADTIEELCDRFVFCDIYWGKEVHRCEDRFKALLDRYDIIIDETLPCFVENQYYKEDDNFVEIEKGMWLDKDKVEKGVYGAVWTNKGLIYVAKMNDRGELELI